MAVLSLTEDVFLDAKKAARMLGERVKKRKPVAVQAIFVNISDTVEIGVLAKKRPDQFCLATLDAKCEIQPSPFVTQQRQSALTREYNRGRGLE